MDFEREELNKSRREWEEEKAFRKKQMKMLKIGFAMMLTVIFSCCFVMMAAVKGWFPFASAPAETNPMIQTDPIQTESTVPTEPTYPADTVIHLVAGGDVNVTDRTVAAGLSEGSYDYQNLFMDLIPVLAGGDLTVLNFEGNLYGTPYGKNSAPQALAQALANAGVDILQTANSRSIANGLTGLRATLDGIRQAGMEPVGTFTDKKEFEKTGGYIIREVDGVRIAFVAFTKGMDDLLSVPAGGENCVNLLYEDYYSTFQKVNKDGIKKVLGAVREEKPDLTVALLHWGSEYNDNISKTQKEICKLMREEGVNAIIGTHPHYVQQMVYEEDTGFFTAYSLGDLVSDGDRAGTDYSVLLDLEITKDGKTGTVRITGFRYVPVYLFRQEDGSMRVLRIQEAVTAYESNYVGKISDEVYQEMKTALTRIEGRVNAKVPE